MCSDTKFLTLSNHVLRTDATPGTPHKIEVRREYISLTVDVYRLVERKAHAHFG